MSEEPFLPKLTGNNPTDGASAKEGDQNRTDNPSPDKQSSASKSGVFATFVGACNIGIAWGLSAMSDHFDAHGFSAIAVICRCGECLVFLLLVALLVKEAWPRPRVVWPTFGVSAVGLILIFIVSSRPVTTPKPHLILGLTTSHARDKILELTNAALIHETNVVVFNNATPLVSIDLLENEPSVVLTFEIANDPIVDRPTASESLVVSGLEVNIGFSNDIDVKMDPQWTQLLPFPGNPGFRIFNWKSPRLLLPGGIPEQVPPIEIVKSSKYASVEGSTKLPFTIQVASKEGYAFAESFWLLIGAANPGHTNIMPPQIVSPKNVDFLKNGKAIVRLRAE
jgi:hypothetical protein